MARSRGQHNRIALVQASENLDVQGIGSACRYVDPFDRAVLLEHVNARAALAPAATFGIVSAFSHNLGQDGDVHVGTGDQVVGLVLNRAEHLAHLTRAQRNDLGWQLLNSTRPSLPCSASQVIRTG